MCICHLLGSRAGGSPTHVPAEEIPEQAEGSDVNLDPQPATSNGDASTQEGEPTMDIEPTTSSSTLVPERSQEAQKYEEAKPVINPFLLTASYLVDVHASKVGMNQVFLGFSRPVCLWLNIIFSVALKRFTVQSFSEDFKYQQFVDVYFHHCLFALKH